MAIQCGPGLDRCGRDHGDAGRSSDSVFRHCWSASSPARPHVAGRHEFVIVNLEPGTRARRPIEGERGRVSVPVVVPSGTQHYASIVSTDTALSLVLGVQSFRWRAKARWSRQSRIKWTQPTERPRPGEAGRWSSGRQLGLERGDEGSRGPILDSLKEGIVAFRGQELDVVARVALQQIDQVEMS